MGVEFSQLIRPTVAKGSLPCSGGDFARSGTGSRFFLLWRDGNRFDIGHVFQVIESIISFLNQTISEHSVFLTYRNRIKEAGGESDEDRICVEGEG